MANVLYFDYSDGYRTLYVCQNSYIVNCTLYSMYWTIYVRVNFIRYKLYLYKLGFKYRHTHTHVPRAQTLVVIRTFSFPSRNLWMMEAR